MPKAPPVLLGYQQRWISDTAKVRLCEKSRRIGLSWAEAANCVLTAAASTGQDALYIGYSREMAREFIEDCAEFARSFQAAVSAIDEELYDDEGRQIQVYKLLFNSGHKILALSSKPSNLRGKQGHVVVDEAAFHPDLPGLSKAAMALLMWGGDVVLISSHNGQESEFNDILEETRAGKKPYSPHRITLDDALADGLFRRICLVSGRPWTQDAEDEWRQEIFDYYGEDSDEELLCIPSAGGGRYLSRNLIEAAMRDNREVARLALENEFLVESAETKERVIRDWLQEHLADKVESLPQNARHFLGEDFGRTGDLTVLAPFSECEDLSYDAPFLVELRNVPFESQKTIVLWLLERLPNFTRAAFDAGGNGQYLAEQVTLTYPGRVEAIHLNEKFYREQMPPFRAGFEQARLRLPRHADVLRDLRAIEIVRGVPKISGERYKGSDGRMRHADAAVALWLGWYACHNGVTASAMVRHPEERDPFRRRTIGDLRKRRT